MTATPANRHPLTGRLIRLSAYDPQKDGEHMAQWSQNSEFQQLLDSDPAVLRTPKQIQEWIEKHMDEMYGFSIHTLENDEAIGFCDLGGLDWVCGNAWVGIGIGDPAYWGKGYGSDAMNEILRYAFETLNLRRVSLNVFVYNERAHKSYLKVGFQEEGRLRQWMVRGGERYDLIYMGIMRDEWEAMQAQTGAQKEQPVHSMEEK